ncbi:MAG: hypothetical protein OEW42_20350, partial [Acidimicrobiia bacterium]|nr:hypothetical protein [Acidimicrobiia bacterium]
MNDTLKRLGRATGVVGAGLVIAFVAVVLGAVAAGYRPVVIQTGSMGDAAPAGSLVIAAPRDAADVAAGDVLVMRRPGVATV